MNEDKHTVVRALARLGGFFPADVHARDERPSGGWRTVRSLLDDPAPLQARVELVQRTLTGRPPASTRVAGSVVQLGLVARMLAPALAVRALGLGSISLDSADLWWRDELAGAFPLSITGGPPGSLLDGAPSEITAYFARDYRVPDRTLWGNLASTADTAATLIARARPDRAADARAAADAVLADPRVEGGRLRSGPGFQRHSCCLLYQAAGSRAAICDDCVLAGRVRAAQFRNSAL